MNDDFYQQQQQQQQAQQKAFNEAWQYQIDLENTAKAIKSLETSEEYNIHSFGSLDYKFGLFLGLWGLIVLGAIIGFCSYLQ